MLINCPNMCGLENRPRGEIQEHLPTCPKAGSGCPFAEFGCDYTGGREHLQQHIKEQPVKHLSYLCDGVLDLKVFSINVAVTVAPFSNFSATSS